MIGEPFLWVYIVVADIVVTFLYYTAMLHVHRERLCKIDIGVIAFLWFLHFTFILIYLILKGADKLAEKFIDILK